MKVLLTHAYFLDEDEKERRIMKPYPPLGILYLSAYLRAQGISVDLYDSTFGSLAELFSLLDSGVPGVLGIYANLMTRRNAVVIAEHARAVGWKVILGGPEPANYALEYLQRGADVVVRGEGEIPLARLLAAGFDRSHFPAIGGLSYLDDAGRLVETGDGEKIAQLDTLPWPDRERIDTQRYVDTWRTHHGLGSLSVITARGCPYRCDWCSHSVYGHSHRRRSPQAVADEVAHLKARYSPDMLWMADDVFTIHRGWLEQYADALRTRGIHLPFECITRADRVDERIAGLLAEMGCLRVWIGSESGSQKILNAMERGVTTTQVERAVSLCRDAGVPTGMFLMWGYEGETLHDIEQTVQLIKNCRPDVFFTTLAYPIKGTPFYNKVADRLVRIAPWHQSSDREIRIAGQPSRDFYRLADELLRQEVAASPDETAIHNARTALHQAAKEQVPA